MLDFTHKSGNKFEINLVVRDADGNPTKHRKRYATDSPFKLWQFYMRYQGRPKRKKKSDDKEPKKKYRKPKVRERLPVGSDATKIMKQVNEYADQIREKRERESLKRDEFNN